MKKEGVLGTADNGPESFSRSAWRKAGEWRAVRAFTNAGQVILAKKWTFLLLGVGFLLGRAVILESLMPFAAAYFAVMYFMRRDLFVWIAAALVAGSWFAAEPAALWIATEIAALFLLLKGLEAYEKAELSTAPILVFASMLLVGLFKVFIFNTLGWYNLLMVVVEASLAFVLTLVFIHAIPVLTMTRKSAALRHEEIICLMILLASVMTGAVGWVLYGMSAEHVMSRYMLLLFAMAGGAPLGASVGVVAGLILSLADFGAIVQMSMLAFAGLLAGLLREGGKMAAAFGLLLGTSILTIYIGTQADVMNSTWESVAAAVLLMLTPRSVIRTIARYVPGTNEHAKSQHDYAKRVREVTAERVLKFSEVFRQLSSSFGQLTQKAEEIKREDELGHFMNAVSQRSCGSCHRQHACWGDKYFHTYKMMTEMMTAVEENRAPSSKEYPRGWGQHCVKTPQVMSIMRHQYELYQNNRHWKKQLSDSRQLVADQLFGVSQVMDDLSKEIRREGQTLHLQEEQIREAVEGLGLSILGVDIVNLEEGNVEIEVYHSFEQGFDECRKIIAPLLSDIMGEHIAVKSETLPDRHGEPTLVTFGSAKQFEVETGVAEQPKAATCCRETALVWLS